MVSFSVPPVVGSTTAFHIVAGYTVFPFSFSFFILAMFQVLKADGNPACRVSQIVISAYSVTSVTAADFR